MEDHTLLAKTIWLLFLCFSCKFVMAFKGSDEPQWPNHGGGIQNRREAFYERKINPKVVSKLTKQWQFVRGHNVTATPSVSSDGVVYFPSSNGFLYAVRAKTGDAIWQKNLTKLTKSPTTVFSRTTPVITKDLRLVAIYGPALLLALDRNTGDIVWSTLLDSHILAVLTMSGTVYERYGPSPQGNSAKCTQLTSLVTDDISFVAVGGQVSPIELPGNNLIEIRYWTSINLNNTMEDHTLLAKTIWLLFLCFSCKFVMAFKGSDEPQWPNHGGGIQNRREAFYERKINPKVVSKLTKQWQFVTGHNVTATPSVSSDGVVYFPSSNGFLYAVRAETGDAIWQKNLTKLTKSPTTVFSRTTPVITKDLLLVAIYGPALMLAVDRNTGDIVWSTLLDSHILAVLTMSGTVYESSFFVGTSSLEENLGITDPNCCNFQGSFVKIDLRTGVIKWRTIVLPDNHGNTKLYSGAAIWGSSPPIDVHRKLVYFATGNLYTVPSDIEQCETNRLKQKNPVVPDPCIKPDDHSESILALDLDNGTIIWSHHLGTYDTWNLYCVLVKQPSPNCPPIPGPDADFGEAPLLYTILDDSVHPQSTQDVVIAGQKNGIVWALDRDDGHIVWATVAGTGGAAGGASWGSATDGQRVYTNIINSNRLNFTLLPSHEVTIGGGWVALDANDGSILWSTAAPNSSIAYGPVTVANGVVFVTAYGVPYGALLALEATSGEVLWQYNASSSLAGGVSVVNGCVYLGEGSTGISELAAPISVGGSHVDAFCLQFHH